MARLLLLAVVALALGAHGAAAARRLSANTTSSLGFDPATDSYTMFVQLAQGATLAPKEQGANAFTLTLDGTTPLIFTFKDRPE